MTESFLTSDLPAEGLEGGECGNGRAYLSGRSCLWSGIHHARWRQAAVATVESCKFVRFTSGKSRTRGSWRRCRAVDSSFPLVPL